MSDKNKKTNANKPILHIYNSKTRTFIKHYKCVRIHVEYNSIDSHFLRPIEGDIIYNL